LKHNDGMKSLLAFRGLVCFELANDKVYWVENILV